MRKIKFTTGELYHIYNRGNNKRTIFSKPQDLNRFLQGMNDFNTINPIGSLYLNSFRKELRGSTSKLVNFICYCLNPNHFHFIVKQTAEEGITKLMHRIGTGYTRYFNDQYENSGSLFQGRFKANLIDSNKYLLHLSAYINLNGDAHSLRGSASKLSISSWNEYIQGDEHKKNSLCNKKIILSQFKNLLEYKKFAEESLINIKSRKEMLELLEKDQI